MDQNPRGCAPVPTRAHEPEQCCRLSLLSFCIVILLSSVLFNGFVSIESHFAERILSMVRESRAFKFACLFFFMIVLIQCEVLAFSSSRLSKISTLLGPLCTRQSQYVWGRQRHSMVFSFPSLFVLMGRHSHMAVKVVSKHLAH